MMDMEPTLIENNEERLQVSIQDIKNEQTEFISQKKQQSILAMSSTIFVGQFRETTPKLVKFIILVGQMRHHEASKMLGEFSQQSYYTHLSNILNHLHLATTLQNEIVRYRGITTQLKEEISRLNYRLPLNFNTASSHLSQTSQQHFLTVAKQLQAGNIEKARKLAQIYKLEKMRIVIGEVEEYLWLKYEASGRSNNQALRFSSAEGEGLKQLVTTNSSLYSQTITFLKNQFPKIITNSPLDQLPPFMDSEFKKSYETFITALREMKNTFYDFERSMRERLTFFSRQYGVQMSQLLEGGQFLQSFLQGIEKLLERRHQPKTFFKKAISPISSIISPDSEFSSNPSSIQLRFPLRRRRESGNEEVRVKVQQMNKILSLHLPPIQNFKQLSLPQQLQQLIKKVTELADEVDKIKLNDEILAKSFRQLQDHPGRDSRESVTNCSILEQAPLLLHKKTTQESMEELKLKAKALEKSLQEERSKRIKGEEINTNLLLKLKSYPVKENTTIICTSNTKEEPEQTELAALREEIDRLKQEVSEKTAKVLSLEAARREEKKRYEREKDQLLQGERSKMRKMRDEYDQLLEQIAKLNNLYQERLLLSQRDSTIDINQDKHRMKQELTRLTAENHSLRQKLANKETEVLSQESSDFSDSLVDRLNLQSRILPNCDQRQWQEKISELEFKNELLANQVEKLNTFYNAIIDSQSSECTQLREEASKLLAQKQQLTDKIRLSEIRTMAFTQGNASKLYLFPFGFIFDQFDYQERLFLIEQLESYTGPIRRTRLLYRADPLNRTNFHKYIDGHRNIVLIFKTIYGKLIAAYSEEAFAASGIVRGHGLLMSLWGRKVFQPKERRTISYDDYFLIFGNSEIRIKVGEFKLFSNFGIANGFYNTRGEKVHALLGEDRSRQVDLSHFEVYALDLQN